MSRIARGRAVEFSKKFVAILCAVTLSFSMTFGSAPAYAAQGSGADNQLAAGQTELAVQDDSSGETSISTATIDEIANQLYTGKPIEPDITVKVGETTLVKDTDYTVSYKDNTELGRATVTVTGKGTYEGTKTARFAIYTTDLAKAEIDVNNQPYTGSEIVPDAGSISLYSGGLKLKLGEDFEIECSNNTAIGTAKITATGKGDFSGTVEGTFEIEPFFTLYTKADKDAEPVEVKRYRTYDDFMMLSDESADPTSGMMFQWTVLTADKYVRLSDIFSDSGVEAGAEDRVTYTGRDNWSQSLTWGELSGNFYPNAVNGHTAAEAEGAYEVPAILAMNYTTTGVNPDKDIANAKAAEDANKAKLAEGATPSPDAKVGDATTPRLIHGVAEQNFTDDNSWNHWGWTSGSIIGSITITDTKNIADARVSVNDVSYTGEAVDPDVTVRDGSTTLVKGVDYTVSAKNNTEISSDKSKASVVVKGIGNYTGSVTKEFSVKPFFTLYTKANASADPVEAKVYKTYNEFMKLADSDEPVSGQMFQWAVLTANSYVKVKDILADAGVDVPQNSARVIYGARDNWANSLTWGELNGKFYPNAVNGHTAAEAEGAVETPLILAMNYVTTFVNPSKGIANSAAAEKENIANLKAGGTPSPDAKVGDATTPRLIHGVAEQNFTDDNSWNHWGWTMGSIINSLTIVDAQSISDAVVDPIADLDYTGGKLTPEVTVKKGDKTLVKDTDYSVRYSDNTIPGEAKVTVTGINDYTGSTAATFNIKPLDTSKLTISEIEKQSYTGEPIEPALTVSFGENELSAETDYKVEYKDNVKPGKATVTISEITGFSGTATADFDIVRDLSGATVSEIAEQAYTGSAIEPSVTVKLDDADLVANTDYSLLYSNNTEPGTARVAVLGKGYYTGSVATEFVISDTAAKDDAAKVVSAIEAIGTVGSSADADKVAVAVSALDALSAGARAYVTDAALKTLSDAQDSLAKAVTEEAVKAAEEKATATANQAAAAASQSAAVAASQALTSANQSAASAVVAIIDSIGTVTSLDAGSLVKAARGAYNALTADQKALVTNEDKLVAAETAIANLEKAADAATPTGKTALTVNAIVVKASSISDADAATVKKLTLGAKVKKISSKSFANCPKLKTLVVKTKKLTANSVKSALKGSKVKTVKVQLGSVKENKTYIAKYKKVFAKANVGVKVAVK